MASGYGYVAITLAVVFILNTSALWLRTIKSFNTARQDTETITSVVVADATDGDVFLANIFKLKQDIR